MMPEETQAAVEWALVQDDVTTDAGIDRAAFVHWVREYFDAHNIPYGSETDLGRPFDAKDLDPYVSGD